jgi:hypothetical protein
MAAVATGIPAIAGTNVADSVRPTIARIRQRLAAEIAADDLFLDLSGAAEDRLDMAEPPEPTIVPDSSGLVLPPVKAGSIWSREPRRSRDIIP